MNTCLACGGKNLELCVDLGDQPLANNFVSDEKYPLQLIYCKDCYHAQLSVFIDPKTLYKHYAYVSGTSNTLRQWFSDFADRFDDVGSILDIASNDGSLLLEFMIRGWDVLGVDPAENIYTQGVPTIHEFFGEDSEVGQFDVITAFNVLAHGPDPLGMLKGVYRALKKDGEAYIMVSQSKMFENGQFDTVYHEHHSYFCLNSFQVLANRAGFEDISYSIEPIHGGSLLFRLTKHSSDINLTTKRPDFEGFKSKVDQIRAYKIIGYGAAAKATVTINHLHQDLDYIVDEAPMKIGKRVPGTKIQIVDPELMAEDEDNLIIIIYAWNFYDEIVEKIKKLRPNRADVFVRYWQ